MQTQTELNTPASSTPNGEAVEEALNSITQQLSKAAAHYDKRVPNEIDLIAIVRERLINHGLGDRIAAFDNSRFIREAAGISSSAQQYHLNRWLTLQFMSSPRDTAVQRYALIYEINAIEWLKIFDRVILPALIDFDLVVEI